MGAGVAKRQRVIVPFIHQHPVGMYVAVALAPAAAVQRVVAELLGQLLAADEHEHNVVKLPDVPTALDEQLALLFEMRGVVQCVFIHRQGSSKGRRQK